MKLKLINLDKKFNPEKIVTNPTFFDKQKGFTDDGIFSEKIFGQLQNENYQFSCQCGATKGKFYLGHNCPQCNTIVSFTESIASKIGWINLSNEYEFINPIMYQFIKKIIGKKNLERIIMYDIKLDKDGNLLANEEIEDEQSQKEFKKNPYINYGITKFIKNYKEIIQFFIDSTTSKKSRKDKENVYKFIRKNKDKLFISKYPIIPVMLRPVVVLNGSLLKVEINNAYNKLINYTHLINTSEKSKAKSDIEIPPILSVIQVELLKIFDELLNCIKGKTGYIRGNIMGKPIAHIKLP